jgi:hypothetical protein
MWSQEVSNHTLSFHQGLTPRHVLRAIVRRMGNLKSRSA